SAHSPWQIASICTLPPATVFPPLVCRPATTKPPGACGAILLLGRLSLARALPCPAVLQIAGQRHGCLHRPLRPAAGAACFGRRSHLCDRLRIRRSPHPEKTAETEQQEPQASRNTNHGLSSLFTDGSSFADERAGDAQDTPS